MCNLNSWNETGFVHGQYDYQKNNEIKNPVDFRKQDNGWYIKTSIASDTFL